MADVTITAGATSVHAPLLLRVELTLATNRHGYPQAGVVLSAGLPAPYAGQLIYLALTLANARAIAALYTLTNSTVPAVVAGHDADFDGWQHHLAGDIDVHQDQTLNGIGAPWLVSIPVQFKVLP